MVVVFSFAAEYVYARARHAQSPAKALVADGAEKFRCRFPTHRSAERPLLHGGRQGHVIRFLIIHQTNGNYATALDACQICGAAGYRQEGQNIVCRNCGAAIYLPSIGEAAAAIRFR